VTSRKHIPAFQPYLECHHSSSLAGELAAVDQAPTGIGLLMTQHFGYAIDRRYLPVLLPFGLRRAKDGVTLTDEGSFVATFGFSR
jgi:hypothetical protein